jgi:hypothetical protein
LEDLEVLQERRRQMNDAPGTWFIVRGRRLLSANGHWVPGGSREVGDLGDMVSVLIEQQKFRIKNKTQHECSDVLQGVYMMGQQNVGDGHCQRWSSHDYLGIGTVSSFQHRPCPPVHCHLLPSFLLCCSKNLVFFDFSPFSDPSPTMFSCFYHPVLCSLPLLLAESYSVLT